MLLIAAGLVGGSSPSPGDRLERIRFYTRQIEFDFVGWTFDAFGVKLEQFVLGTSGYIPVEARPDKVLAYLDMLREIRSLEREIELVFSNPDIQEPLVVSTELRLRLEALKERRAVLEPVAETIVQAQIGQVVADAGLALGGQTLPPALYHTTPPPHALIISPRETIRQDFSISISPRLSLDEQVALEAQVDQEFGISSLVVGIAGIGLYPTMVMETTDINWLAEVVAHEWIHIYLTLRPLGVNYLTSPELRTMNETAASIAGKELGRLVVGRFYPEFLPPPPVPVDTVEQDPAVEVPADPPSFDFRREMRRTRVRVDALLLEGAVEEAEAYMETRRRFFWENGYQLRKLNQAYFAFYGAYADAPGGGAAGEDPVGAAVRALRAQSSSLAAFVNRISWMTSFEHLQEATGVE